MDFRSQVYSPAQNIAVWIAAWHLHHTSTDNFTDAMLALGGPTDLTLLARIRALLDAAHAQAPMEQPLVRLALSGPGDPGPHGVIISKGAHPHEALLLREVDTPPALAELDPHRPAEWDLVDPGVLPPSDYLMPGDAGRLLAQATAAAADMIEAKGFSTDALHNPRLTVGALSDFYDTPGLPDATPGRAAQLFARADRVAAIIETVGDRMGEHSVDTELIPLWRHIRRARITGVEYAARDMRRYARP